MFKLAESLWLIVVIMARIVGIAILGAVILAIALLALVVIAETVKEIVKRRK